MAISPMGDWAPDALRLKAILMHDAGEWHRGAARGTTAPGVRRAYLLMARWHRRIYWECRRVLGLAAGGVR